VLHLQLQFHNLYTEKFASASNDHLSIDIGTGCSLNMNFNATQ